MRLVLLEGGKPPSDIAHVTLSCSSGAAKPPHDACITVTAFKRDGLEKLPAPAAILSLAPSSKSDQRQAKKLQEFVKYLHHGVLGTSAPKAAKVSISSASDSINTTLGFNTGFICPPSADDYEKGILRLSPQNASETPSISHTPTAAAGTDLGKIASKAAMDDLHTKRYKGIAAVPDSIRGKVEWLFKGLTTQQKANLWIDEVAVYSVTQSQIAEQITDITAKALRTAGVTVRDAVVVDAMACVGGNTLSFAGAFRETHAVEISSTRHECLAHNVQVMGLSDRVRTHCGDALAAISAAKAAAPPSGSNSSGSQPASASAAAASATTVFNVPHAVTAASSALPQLPARVDAVFFDPPWGGPEYAAMPSIDMYVGDMHLGDALKVCSGWAHLAVVKAPMNFNIQGMLDRAGGCASLTQPPTHLRKMQVMTVALQAVPQKHSDPAEEATAGAAAAPPAAKKARTQ